MMFIPLKWTPKRHIYGHIMDHMNSGWTVWTAYGNHSIYCSYGVPIVPIISLKVDIFCENIDFEMLIQRPYCPYRVHISNVAPYFLLFLLLFFLAFYWKFLAPLIIIIFFAIFGTFCYFPCVPLKYIC